MTAVEWGSGSPPISRRLARQARRFSISRLTLRTLKWLRHHSQALRFPPQRWCEAAPLPTAAVFCNLMHNVLVSVLLLCCCCQVEMMQRIATGTTTDLASVAVPTLRSMLATPIDRQQQPWASGSNTPPTQPDTPDVITFAVRVW
jgi:hypothetical protein